MESGFGGIGYKQHELLRHPRIHNLCKFETQGQQLDANNNNTKITNGLGEGGGAYRLGGFPKYIWASTLGVQSDWYRVWIEIYGFSKSVGFHG